MEFYDEGIVLAVIDFADNQKIFSVLTNSHGLWRGLVWKTNSINIGDIISFQWKAKSAECLGRFYINHTQSNLLFFMPDQKKLLMIKSIAEMCCRLLPERDYCQKMFLFLKEKLPALTYKDYIFFEILLLDALGYALDFAKCAVTGQEDIFYLSPKTGRSVSKIVGDKYKDKLFKIPDFFISGNSNPATNEILYAFEITEYFFKKNVTDDSNVYFFRDRITSGIKNGQQAL